MKANEKHAAIQKFAEKYRLRLKRDEDNQPVISGSRGEIYEYSPTALGVMIISPDGVYPRLWNLYSEKCNQAGMTLRQNGEGEGAFSFNPENEEQARLAIQFAGIKPKRQISETHRQKLLDGLKRSQILRRSAILEGGLRC